MFFRPGLQPSGSSKRESTMKKSSFWMYLKFIFRQWFIWVFMISDLVGLFIGLIDQRFSMPQYVYLIIAFIAFFFSGYKVYNKLYLTIPDQYKPELPVVYFSLIEGNAYYYQIFTKEDSESKYKNLMSVVDTVLPRAELIVNARIENKSKTSIYILSINGNAKDLELPYQFMVPELYQKDLKLSFPILLNMYTSIEFQYRYQLYPNNILTEAQIAVRLASIYNRNTKQPVTNSIEYAYADNKINKLEESTEISIKPLCTQLISYWKEQRNVKILGLISPVKE
jgi:hypothetical protein